MRKFERISKEEFIKKSKENSYDNIILPKRQTINSAGYDFYLPEDYVFGANQVTIVYTGVKVCLEPDEFLAIVTRSSIGIKKGLVLANQVGIIDSDYYNNVDNEGHIMIAFRNLNDFDITLNKGERVAQGIFMKYLKTTDDDVSCVRKGGIGSTKSL